MARRGSKKSYTSEGKGTAEDRAKYHKAWSDMMVTIWRDKIDKFKVYDTGELRNSITESVAEGSRDKATIMHRFVKYGEYQDKGVGREFSTKNGGDLLGQDKDFRAAKGWGEARKPRPWFSLSYYISIRVLIEHEAKIWGDEFVGVLKERLEVDK